jgi:hypothetical protein
MCADISFAAFTLFGMLLAACEVSLGWRFTAKSVVDSHVAVVEGVSIGDWEWSTCSAVSYVITTLF